MRSTVWEIERFSCPAMLENIREIIELGDQKLSCWGRPTWEVIRKADRQRERITCSLFELIPFLFVFMTAQQQLEQQLRPRNRARQRDEEKTKY